MSRGMYAVDRENRIPCSWINAPKGSPLYEPSWTTEKFLFYISKEPLSSSSQYLLDPKYRWTPIHLVQDIKRKANKFDVKVVVIDLMKQKCQISEEEWAEAGVVYNSIEFNWNNPMANIEVFEELIEKRSNEERPENQRLTFAIFSKFGFNKPLALIASYLCQSHSEKMASTIVTLSRMHYPGFIKTKVLVHLTKLAKRKIQLEAPEMPDYLRFQQPQNRDALLKVPASLAIGKYSFPGLSEIGAIKAPQSETEEAIKHIYNLLNGLSGEPLMQGKPPRISPFHYVWNENRLTDIFSEEYRVTIEPEGTDVTCYINRENVLLIIDVNEDGWKYELETHFDPPVAFRGVLQRQRNGNFIIIITDVIHSGNLSFLKDDLDTRLSYVFNILLPKLRTKPGLDFLCRPVAFMKDCRKVMEQISLMNMRCTGLSLIPLNKMSGHSIFIPIGQVLVPFLAVSHSPGFLLLYSTDDATDKRIAIGVAKIEPEAYVLDGMTVLCNYKPRGHYWDVVQYTTNEQKSEALFASGVAYFKAYDRDPLEILKSIEVANDEREKMLQKANL